MKDIKHPNLLGLIITLIVVLLLTPTIIQCVGHQINAVKFGSFVNDIKRYVDCTPSADGVKLSEDMRVVPGIDGMPRYYIIWRVCKQDATVFFVADVYSEGADKQLCRAVFNRPGVTLKDAINRPNWIDFNKPDQYDYFTADNINYSIVCKQALLADARLHKLLAENMDRICVAEEKKRQELKADNSPEAIQKRRDKDKKADEEAAKKYPSLNMAARYELLNSTDSL